MAEHVAESITTGLQGINLDPSNLRAQSYDRTGMLICNIIK